MTRVVLLSLLLCMWGEGARAETNTQIGVVGGLTGQVRLIRQGKTYTMASGTPVRQDDRIETLSDGKVRILFRDDSVLSVGPRSQVVLETFTVGEAGRRFSLKVLQGRFKIAVAKWFLGPTRGLIDLPTAVVGVRGTVVWGDTDLDAVCALDGTVDLTAKSTSQRQSLQHGACRTRMKEGEPIPVQPTAEQLKAYLAEVSLP